MIWWMNLARLAHAQDDGQVGQVGQELIGGALVDLGTQQRLGLVSLGTGCSGTLLNQYWVLTAHHCVATWNDPVTGWPLRAPGEVEVTAAWAPGVVVHPTTMVTYAFSYGLDVALLFLGEGDFGPADTQLFYTQEVDTSTVVQKYGRGYATFASASPLMAASGEGPYRTGTFGIGDVGWWGYTTPTNTQLQSGAGGDSGGPDIVMSGGYELGIAGVQSTCAATGYVPGMPDDDWRWATGISSCNSAGIVAIRDDIVDRIRDVPGGEVWVGLSDGGSFGAGQLWGDGFCTRGEDCGVGDIDGDGFDDVLRFVKSDASVRDSDVWVALSDGTSFGVPYRASDSFCTRSETCDVADVNGDGYDDVVAFVKTDHGANDSDVWVALSNGATFGAPQKWHDAFCTLDEVCATGDVDGDGREDVIAFVQSNGGPNDADVWVSLSTGAGFAPARRWKDYFCTGSQTCGVADMNGDGRDDVVLFVRSDGSSVDADVWVALSTGASFGPATKWKDHFCTGDQTCALGDINGDGRSDGLLFVKTDHSAVDSDVWAAWSDGISLWDATLAQDYFCTLDETCRVGDVNGDGRDDVLAFVRGD